MYSAPAQISLSDRENQKRLLEELNRLSAHSPPTLAHLPLTDVFPYARTVHSLSSPHRHNDEINPFDFEPPSPRAHPSTENVLSFQVNHVGEKITHLSPLSNWMQPHDNPTMTDDAHPCATITAAARTAAIITHRLRNNEDSDHVINAVTKRPRTPSSLSCLQSAHARDNAPDPASNLLSLGVTSPELRFLRVDSESDEDDLDDDDGLSFVDGKVHSYGAQHHALDYAQNPDSPRTITIPSGTSSPFRNGLPKASRSLVLDDDDEQVAASTTETTMTTATTATTATSTSCDQSGETDERPNKLFIKQEQKAEPEARAEDPKQVNQNCNAVESKPLQDGKRNRISCSSSSSNHQVTIVHPSAVPSAITGALACAKDAISCRQRRAEAMERFRRKKAVRCYGRRVRYQIRKRIATTRPRVNGRFAKRCDLDAAQNAA